MGARRGNVMWKCWTVHLLVLGHDFYLKLILLSNSAHTEMLKLSNVEKHCVYYFFREKSCLNVTSIYSVGSVGTYIWKVLTQFSYFSSAVNEFPVLKADGIKYIMIFRNQVSFSFTLMIKTYRSLLLYTCQAWFILLGHMLTQQVFHSHI